MRSVLTLSTQSINQMAAAILGTCPRLPNQIALPCLQGYENWEKGWSPQKRSWCCNSFNRACEEYDPLLHREGESSDSAGKFGLFYIATGAPLERYGV